ncbi:TadE family protein [Limnohabitans sp. 2KL-3]|uniref:TadE family protein n=1 Tax=Limnohabitans sp. 2KL-3 TaxID=1100700 RepID=UPI000B7D2B57|nr:TadE family protein [Limnohabitans sp. 2KL-3]
MKNRHNQNGVAFIELTIVLALFLVPLLIIVIEAGRLLYTYKTLVHQTRNTARYLSVQVPGQNHELAKCLFKTGKLVSNCNDADLLLPGFDNPKFEFSITDSNNNSSQNRGIPVGNSTYPVNLNIVTVSANKYPFKFIFQNLLKDNYLYFGMIGSTFRQVN